MKPRLKGLLKVWHTSKVLKQLKVDIIHSFHYGSDYSEALASRLAGVKWVFTKKNMSWGGSSKNSWWLRSALANGIILQNTDMVNDFYPNSKKTKLIPRGVKHEFYDSDGQFGKKEDPRIIICVANLVPKKGVEILIRAFAMLREDNPQWNIWIIGDDSSKYADEVKDEISALGLSEVIWFSGKKKDIRPFLTKAELFVLPTNTMGEGSPVAILEAMANGKVVIGSAVPGIKDQLAPFPDHLFEVNDPRDLADKLHRFMSAPTEQNKITGSAFVDYVKSKYDFGDEVKAHSDFYKKIVNYRD
jgi:glycosyltransferase involved in cell wall biosynthesis